MQIVEKGVQPYHYYYEIPIYEGSCDSTERALDTASCNSTKLTTIMHTAVTDITITMHDDDSIQYIH